MPVPFRSPAFARHAATTALLAVAIMPPSTSAQEPTDSTAGLPIALTGDWMVVNDGVMGGRSTSTIRQTSTGTIRFAGNVSLENNGGFASVRLVIGESGLSAFTGLRLRLRGDGRRYQIRLRTDDRFDGLAYAARFPTTGEWETIEIPFTSFEPTYRGYRPAGAPPLDPNRIRQLGFLIADEQAGPFALEVAAVHAYAASADAPH